MSKKSPHLWSHEVQETSDAMNLPKGIFTQSAPEIAQALKNAVMESDRTQGSKFESAMSMLDFYINRAGTNLKPDDKARLEQAKVELRKLFGRE